MSTPTGTGAKRLWAAEPSALAGHARIRARIAGPDCTHLSTHCPTLT